MAKNEAKIIIQACKMAFFVVFEKYKTIIRVHCPSNHVEPLQTDYLDESLLAIAADSAERFAKASHFPREVSKINAAIQTEGDVNAEEDCLVDSCPGDASK